MTKEEWVKRLRLSKDTLPWVELSEQEAREIADMLENEATTKHPEPGTFVRFKYKDGPWQNGIVRDEQDGIMGSDHAWYEWEDTQYRPVYAVTPPPFEEWEHYKRAWHCYEHTAWLSISHDAPLVDSASGKHITTITREEMGRREVSNGMG